jgi:hypothetical protein
MKQARCNVSDHYIYPLREGPKVSRSSRVETVSIDENIRVGAAFDKRKVRPMWFLWRNRYYKVRTVNFTWKSNQGAARIHHYSVHDGNSAYELCFNSITLEWTLSKISMG